VYPYVATVMLIVSYIDDSADGNRDRVVLAGCFMSTPEEWEKLAVRWRERLSRDGLNYFRSTEYYSFRGEFERFCDPISYPKPEGKLAASALRDDLDRIIQGSEVIGMAVCIPMDVYRTIRDTEPDAAQIFHDDAFITALQSLMTLCAETVRDSFEGDARIAFVCDETNRAREIARIYSEFKEANLPIKRFMQGLVHKDDKQFPQLQAADLAAHIAKERFEDWLSDPATAGNKESLESRLERVKIASIRYWSREYMLHALGREREYRRWLK
jgi:Protein of unknown function (DUF3800)